MRAMRRALICLLVLFTLASAPALAALGILLGLAIVDLAALMGLMQPSGLASSLLQHVRSHPQLAIGLIAGLELGVLGVLGLGALRGPEERREAGGHS